jgi:hypothetical protein
MGRKIQGTTASQRSIIVRHSDPSLWGMALWNAPLWAVI